MYSKFLFLGLGGSGGKTLRFLKRDLSRWLERNGASPEIPKGWKFLHIDTPTNPDGDELNELVPQISIDEYLGLINPGIDMGAVQNNLDSRSDLATELMSWRVSPAAVTVPLTLGAGQFRAIGRTVAMWSASQMKSAIDSCVSDLSSGAVETELNTLYQLINGEEPEDGKMRTFVIVISSLAGGTGAGLMQDVCDIIRASDIEFSDQIFGVLYAAEAFDALGGDGTGGVQPNSLAAFSELLNGYWYNGQDPQVIPVNPAIEDQVLQAAGLPKTIKRSGPNYPFLVGRKNTGGVDYETPTKLFEMIGSSLTSWVTSPAVAKEFLAYTITNWDNAAINRNMEDTSEVLVKSGNPELGEPGIPAVSGLGFGRLSVGTEYFEEYAMQRIVRSAHSHAMNYHLYSTDATDAKIIEDDDGTILETNDPAELARRIAATNLTSFLRKANLDEIGPKANDIIDRLTPLNRQEIESELESGIKNISGVNGSEKEETAAEWCRLISDAYTITKDDYHRKFRDGLDKQSIKWVRDIQEDVLAAAEEFISRIGLYATSQLCFLVADTLENDTAENLHSEAETNKEWASKSLEYGLVSLQGVQGRLSAQAPLVSEAIAETKRVETFFGDFLRMSRGQELCGQLAQKLLRPLGRSIREAQETAEFDWDDGSSGKAPIASFVPWNNESPPEALKPPVSEYTLIDPETYPDKFTELTQAQMTSEGSDDIQIEIQSAILNTNWIRETQDTSKPKIRELQTLTAETSWKPEADWLDEPSRNLKAAVRTDRESLISRVLFWLRQPGYPMGRFLDTSLRSYLGDDELLAAEALSDVEREARKVRFISQFKAALNSAAPLINIDNNCFQVVHNESGKEGVGLYYAFSEIPLDAHPVGNDLQKYLSSLKAFEEQELPSFNIDSTVSHIDITTAIAAPVSPLVIDSIWEPIAQAYQKTSSAGGQGMSSFWLRRRSRLHQRFIPAPQQIIMPMIRGWITAGFLGVLGDSQLHPNTGVLKIGLEGPSPTAEFPYPLLSDVMETQDELPAILEALPLAYMKCNTLNNITPLEPYVRLRELGRQGGKASNQLFGYDQLSLELGEWVQKGSYPKSALSDPTLKEPVSGTSVTPEDRLEVLIENLKGRKTRLEDRQADFITHASASPSLLTTNKSSGLYILLHRALLQMEQAAESTKQKMSAGHAAGDDR